MYTCTCKYSVPLECTQPTVDVQFSEEAVCSDMHCVVYCVYSTCIKINKQKIKKQTSLYMYMYNYVQRDPDRHTNRHTCTCTYSSDGKPFPEYKYMRNMYLLHTYIYTCMHTYTHSQPPLPLLPSLSPSTCL